jgi:hypothetical protein
MFPVPTSLAEARELIASVEAAASVRGMAISAPPEPPYDCCGRGCYLCVFSVYYEALHEWARRALD